MLRLVRRLAILSALSVAFSSALSSAQSQPASPGQHSEAVPGQATAPAPASHSQTATDNDKPINPADVHNASLWRDPGNISAQDLLYGEAGKDGQPVPPFKFIAEDTNGTNPKFDIQDANGKKWRVKLGEEARPEVVASRLLWAVGYYVNDDFLLHIATIQGLDIKRGANHVHNGSQVIDARFERKPDQSTKLATWEWKSNPFTSETVSTALRAASGT